MSDQTPYRLWGSKRGQALIAQLVIALLLVAVILSLTQWNSQLGRAVARKGVAQKAVDNAESGIATIMDTLRKPQWVLTLPPGGAMSLGPTVNTADSRGSYLVTVRRDAVDNTLLEAVSTGYYQLMSGNSTDSNSQTAQIAVVTARIRARSMGDFFAAVPGSLVVSYGTDISAGSVYARDLTFLPGDPASPHTRVKSAYYFASLQPASPESFVDFLDPPFKPQNFAEIAHVNGSQASEPNLVAVDASLESFYKSWAGADQLAAGSFLSGNLAPPVDPSNRHNVFFCPGDVYLGTGDGTTSAHLHISDPIILFSTGTVYIVGDIKSLQPGAWMAVIAEGNIVFKASAPNNLQISGTFIAGKALYAETGPVRPPAAQLKFNGGFQAQQGTNFGDAWPNRTYTYERPPDTILLPFFLDVEAYNILRGRSG